MHCEPWVFYHSKWTMGLKRLSFQIKAALQIRGQDHSMTLFLKKTQPLEPNLGVLGENILKFLWQKATISTKQRLLPSQHTTFQVPVCRKEARPDPDQVALGCK